MNATKVLNLQKESSLNSGKKANLLVHLAYYSICKVLTFTHWGPVKWDVLICIFYVTVLVKPAWLHPSYLSISYYTALKLPFLTFCRSFKLKKGREKGIQDEWFGLSWLAPGQSLLFVWKSLLVGQEFSKATARLLAPSKELSPKKANTQGNSIRAPLVGLHQM